MWPYSISAKLRFGVSIAKELNGEIISADSMQIYKEMNIGTAKPTVEEMQGVPHHLIDFVEPDKEYNVSLYREECLKTIKDIISRGKTPIIVGGTGLYVNTIVNGVEFSNIETDELYRKELEKLAKEKGADYLFEELKIVDPESANKIEKNNIRRVIRALEIYKTTGKTKSRLDKESIKETEFDFLIYGILWDREKLYDRINFRVDQMIKDGLVLEVERLQKKYDISKTALQGLGYKEVISYLNHEISYEEMIETIKMESRRYAKRQMTWFKKTNGIEWLDGENKEKMIKKIVSDYSN